MINTFFPFLAKKAPQIKPAIPAPSMITSYFDFLTFIRLKPNNLVSVATDYKTVSIYHISQQFTSLVLQYTHLIMIFG